MRSADRGAIGLAYERVRLQLQDPLVISKGVEEHADVLHVQLAWGGAVGHGEAAPQAEDGQTIASAVGFLDAIAGELGDDPFAIEAILARVGDRPGESAATAAVDAALHDLVGKLLGQPTWRLLGLAPGGPPTTYTISLDTPEEMARQAGLALARFPGVRSLKLKLGAGADVDLERVRAIAALPGVRLIVDANEAWALDEALAILPALDELGVALVEQPLARGSVDGPELRRRSPLPLFADEDCHTLADVARVARSSHGINVKLAKCGGIREALRMIHAARALGLGVMLGCMVESGLGISAAVQISSLVDAVDLDANLMLDHDPAPGLALRGGVQTAADAPGLGVATEVWSRAHA